MEGLVSALQIIFPNSEVQGFHTYRLLGADREDIRQRVRESDILFTMPLTPNFGEFSESAAQDLCEKVQFVPQVVFPAFHPDIIYIARNDGQHVQSPLTDYNSNIAASAFLLGLGVDQTIQLYNTYIFQAMGYFNLFPQCERDMLTDFDAYGINLRTALERWNEHPDFFMYSTNHPRGFVLADVAVEASRAAELDAPSVFPCQDMMPDRLAGWVIYPVFPEIAARLGKRGHYYFKSLSLDRMNVMALEDFVERSFRLYERENTSEWVIPTRLETSKKTLKGLVAVVQ